MARRASSPTKAEVTRAVSGAMACGIKLGEVRVLRDGSIVIVPAGVASPAILDDDIDAKIDGFGRR